MGKSSINGPFSMAMLNNQRVAVDTMYTMFFFFLCVCVDDTVLIICTEY